MFPIIFDKHDPQIEYGALKEGSLPSVCSSSDSMDKPWTPPPNQKEDLYSWMAKQQNGNSKNHRDKDKQEVCMKRWSLGSYYVNGSLLQFIDSLSLMEFQALPCGLHEFNRKPGAN